MSDHFGQAAGSGSAMTGADRVTAPAPASTLYPRTAARWRTYPASDAYSAGLNPIATPFMQ